MTEEKNFTILNTTELPDSEVEIEVEFTPLSINKFRVKALANFQDAITLPGFRKGYVPEKMIIEKMGEVAILEECVELALAEYYLDIIKETGKNVIGAPKATITKLAPGNNVIMKIVIAEIPTVTLPDYKKFAKEVVSKKEVVTVEDKEVEDAILEIRKRFATSAPPANSEEKQETTKETKEELPELNDEFVSKIGSFSNVEDFKTKLRESILKEKNIKEQEKVRLEIMERMLASTQVSLPKILIQSEQDRMMAQFSDNIESMGIKKEEYLKQIGKSEEVLREEWIEEASKRAKTQLILNTIISTEKLEPSSEEVKKESAHLISHYKNSDPLRIDAYVETMLANENAWKLLEGQEK